MPDRREADWRGSRGGCVGTRQEFNVRQNIEVTSQDQISVQLESLILAQNERWRQASHMQVERS